MQEWLELANGCICCSVKCVFRTRTPLSSKQLNTRRSRDSGVNAIESLMERRGAFDYILLETTGLADPGNIAPLFWVDEGLGSSIFLDGIVTIVDAKNVLWSLDEKRSGEQNATATATAAVGVTTAHLQISHADVLVVNKSDLVSEEQLRRVEQRLRAINGVARMCVTQHGVVPGLEGVLLDLHAYDDVEGLDAVPQHSRSSVDPVCTPATFPPRLPPYCHYHPRTCSTQTNQN